MSEYVKAIELLKNSLNLLDLRLNVMEHEFNQEVEATIKRNKRSKGKPSIALASWDEMQKYKDDLRDELRGAVVLGSEHGIELNVCRKLSVALDSGNDPIPFVFDADVELEKLIEKIINPNTKPASDPFEAFHDDMKAKKATDEEIAKEWIKTRSPRERNKLLQEGKQAIEVLKNSCRNLRQARKKSAKR